MDEPEDKLIAKNAIKPRHEAASFELAGGTGPITKMVNLGDYLEVFKEDMTFRIQSPESIDPDETNPEAPWVVSPTSPVGSAHPTVARVFLQSKGLIDSALLSPTVDKTGVLCALHAVKEAILVCESISNRVCDRIDAIIARVEIDGVAQDKRGRGLNPFPQVADLQLDCASFLVQANRSIKSLCEIPQLMLGLPKADANFDYLAKTLAAHVGEESPVTNFVRTNAEHVRYLIDLRNFHEHPKKTRTVIQNFHVMPDGQIEKPTWRLLGEQETDKHHIRATLPEAVDFLRDIAEAMVIHLVMHAISGSPIPYYLQEVPPEDVDRAMPIRYRLGVDFSCLPTRD